MDARDVVQRIVSILTVVVGFCLNAFADPVLIYGGEFNLRIPAEPNSSKGWMADAIIEIPDHFTIEDLDVGVTLTHTSVFDLQLYLQGPDETALCLNMYDPFDEYFEGEDYIQTIFDDEAEIPIEQAQAPFTGRFRPKEGNYLAAFDSQDIYGLWRLRIYDAFYYDTGYLNSFQLMITIPEPATAILLTLGAASMRFSRRPNRKSGKIVTR